MQNKLVYKVGDLISAAVNGEVQVIAHGCNCLCTMGNGIAPLIKSAFPYAYKADCETRKGDKLKLGSFTVGDPNLYGFSGGPLVFNLYSQYNYTGRKYNRRDLDYNALYDALDLMAFELQCYDLGEVFKIGLPKIGAGLAKGDWDIIELMIKKTLCQAGHDVIIYVLDEAEIPENADVIK